MKLKTKKVLWLLPIIIGGGIATSLVVTTTSCSSKHYSFKTDKEVTTYLKKHSVDVDERWSFSEHELQPQDNYNFIRKNVNFDFFVNAGLYTSLIYLWGFAASIGNNHIDLDIDGDTAKIKVESETFNISASIEYQDQVVSLELNDLPKVSFDFKQDYSLSHFITAEQLDFRDVAFFRGLSFFISGDIDVPTIFLSAYDWINEPVAWPTVA